MKIPSIKTLVEKYPIDDLSRAELAIIEGNEPGIAIEGQDEGEQLTHVIAAKWILEEMRDKKIDFKEALREYTKKVRDSIS